MKFRSVRFSREYYNQSDAKKWLKLHKFIPIKEVDIVRNWLRYRITDPRKYNAFSTKMVNPNIELIIGYK